MVVDVCTLEGRLDSLSLVEQFLGDYIFTHHTVISGSEEVAKDYQDGEEATDLANQIPDVVNLSASQELVKASLEMDS